MLATKSLGSKLFLSTISRRKKDQAKIVWMKLRGYYNNRVRNVPGQYHLSFCTRRPETSTDEQCATFIGNLEKGTPLYKFWSRNFECSIQTFSRCMYFHSCFQRNDYWRTIYRNLTVFLQCHISFFAAYLLPCSVISTIWTYTYHLYVSEIILLYAHESYIRRYSSEGFHNVLLYTCFAGSHVLLSKAEHSYLILFSYALSGLSKC